MRSISGWSYLCNSRGRAFFGIFYIKYIIQVLNKCKTGSYELYFKGVLWIFLPLIATFERTSILTLLPGISTLRIVAINLLESAK